MTTTITAATTTTTNTAISMSIPTISNDDDKRFLRRIENTISTVQCWDEDPMLLAECRLYIPFHDINNASNNSNSVINKNVKYSKPEDNNTTTTRTYRFIRGLCRHFKEDVMKWVDKPECIQCGSKEHMESIGVRRAETNEEINGMASRVEQYKCKTCINNPVTVFPRYNSPRTLLQTRCGRCGEFANLFGLYCRSAGLETRYILDVTDHVWIEVYDPEVDMWIMCDSCEGTVDEPSMYEKGWGKQGLCYMIAVGLDHVCDVTARYTRQYHASDFQLRRRNITSNEEISYHIIHNVINKRLLHKQDKDHQSSSSEEEKEERRLHFVRQRLEEEVVGLQRLSYLTSWDDDNDNGGSGRISGSLEWKIARNEAGNQQQQQEQQQNQLDATTDGDQVQAKKEEDEEEEKEVARGGDSGGDARGGGKEDGGNVNGSSRIDIDNNQDNNKTQVEANAATEAKLAFSATTANATTTSTTDQLEELVQYIISSCCRDDNDNNVSKEEAPQQQQQQQEEGQQGRSTTRAAVIVHSIVSELLHHVAKVHEQPWKHEYRRFNINDQLFDDIFNFQMPIPTSKHHHNNNNDNNNNDPTTSSTRSLLEFLINDHFQIITFCSSIDESFIGYISVDIDLDRLQNIMNKILQMPSTYQTS